MGIISKKTNQKLIFNGMTVKKSVLK